MRVRSPRSWPSPHQLTLLVLVHQQSTSRQPLILQPERILMIFCLRIRMRTHHVHHCLCHLLCWSLTKPPPVPESDKATSQEKNTTPAAVTTPVSTASRLLAVTSTTSSGTTTFLRELKETNQELQSRQFAHEEKNAGAMGKVFLEAVEVSTK